MDLNGTAQKDGECIVHFYIQLHKQHGKMNKCMEILTSYMKSHMMYSRNTLDLQ